MISKSAFIRGVQCQKALYLYKNFYNARDKLSAEQLAKFKRGTQVGIYAQKLFPNGVDCSPKRAGDSETWVENTKNQLSQNQSTLYEAAFEFNGSMAAMDIFTQINGIYQAYEVKSSLKVSAVFEVDLAFQTYIIKQSGFDLTQAGIITVNGDYEKQGEINWEQFFRFTDYSHQLPIWHPWIEEQIALAEKTLNQTSIPKVGIGKQCFEPYVCDFIKFCWKKPLSEQWSNSRPFIQTHHQLFAEKGLVAPLENNQNEWPNEIVFMLFAAPAIPMINGCKPYQKTPLAFVLVNLNLHRFEILWIFENEQGFEDLINQLKQKTQSIDTSFEAVDEISHDVLMKHEIEFKFKSKLAIEKVTMIQSEFRIHVDNEINSLKPINSSFLMNWIDENMADLIEKIKN